MTGKTVIVTGASSGIGKQIAANLSGLGAHVVMACRSLERGGAARDEIISDSPEAASRLEVALLDQSSQASLREFVATFTAAREGLDVLINNAGIYPAGRELSVDGIELTWATNVMGYFLLTRLLTETLAASARARVLFVASKLAGELDLGDLQWERRRFGGIRAYKQSKAANRMLAWEFAERLADRRIDVAAIHPGGINSGIGRHQRGLWGLLVRLAFRTQKPTTAGADTATWLASLPDRFETGRFWADRAERECEFRDPDKQRELWAYCEDLISSRCPE